VLVGKQKRGTEGKEREYVRKGGPHQVLKEMNAYDFKQMEEIDTAGCCHGTQS